MIIKVRCRTNLDDYKGKKWPTELACRPVIGDIVREEDGYDMLKIHDITHSRQKVYGTESSFGRQEYEPILILELNK